MPWLDITDELSPQGQQALQLGQVLMFDYEGSPLNLKIMRKKGGRVWAKRIDLYTIDQADDELEKRRAKQP